MSDDKLQVPESSKGDVAHAVAKAGLSAIPLVGGPAVELFQLLVQPPLERRREDWMRSVGERLEDLASKGISLDSLRDNEQFISAVMHATQIALRTHETLKRDSLRNALVNIAIGQAPEEAIQHIFFELVDSLTELHIQILSVFQRPTPPSNLGMGGLVHVLEGAIPNLRGRRELYDKLWKDLYLRGLINTDSLHVTMSGQGLRQKRTTELADEFLSFIRGGSGPAL